MIVDSMRRFIKLSEPEYSVKELDCNKMVMQNKILSSSIVSQITSGKLPNHFFGRHKNEIHHSPGGWHKDDQPV